MHQGRVFGGKYLLIPRTVSCAFTNGCVKVLWHYSGRHCFICPDAAICQLSSSDKLILTIKNSSSYPYHSSNETSEVLALWTIRLLASQNFRVRNEPQSLRRNGLGADVWVVGGQVLKRLSERLLGSQILREIWEIERNNTHSSLISPPSTRIFPDISISASSGTMGRKKKWFFALLIKFS
jgi:hypothetical protein